MQQAATNFEQAQIKYGGKVRTFARNSYRQIPDHEVEDVIQELTVVLWECAVKYDPNRGATFNTYFQQSAKNRIISLMRRSRTKGRTGSTVSLDVEAVAWAVDEYLSDPSAESVALMRMDIREAVAAGGEGVLDGRRRKRAS